MPMGISSKHIKDKLIPNIAYRKNILIFLIRHIFNR